MHLVFVIGLLLAAILSVIGTLFRQRKGKVARSHLRGRDLRSAREVESILTRSREPGDPGIRFGRQLISSSSVQSHIAIMGATGSGKTILHRLIMQSALPLIGKGLSHRALIYDAKQDILATLAGMRLSCPVYTLNSLDARSVAWNIAADVTCPASALQAASILIPEIKADSNPFFTNAARHLLYGAILVLIAQGRPWTLRELILRSRDGVRLKKLLGSFPHTHFLLQYFEHPSTFQNILSTLLTYLCPFEVIAAAWDNANVSVSLREWIRGESILVLGNDEANRTAVDAINRLVFRRLSELLLGEKELSATDTRRTWVFLDEVREAGRLESLPRLLTKGRSKGAAIVLGFQDIAGLHDVYGKQVAEELVGQCSYKAILRLNSPETATWASRLIGSEEAMESRKGHSRSSPRTITGFGTRGESVSHGIVTRPLVLESEFFSLPETNAVNGLSGFFITPATGPFQDCVSGSWLSSNLLSPKLSTSNFDPRPVSHQYLRPLREEECLPREPKIVSQVIQPDGKGLYAMKHSDSPKKETTPHALNCV